MSEDEVDADSARLADAAWDALPHHVVKGSSGDWTAWLDDLPITSGGSRSEEDALHALRDEHNERMRSNANYRALAARRVAERGQPDTDLTSQSDRR